MCVYPQKFGVCRLGRGVQPLVRKLSAPQSFLVAMPTSGHVKLQTEYLEATLGLVKRLEIQ